MKFKEALDLVRETKPIFHKSTFGEALDIICSAAELAQKYLTQGKTPPSATPDGEICPYCGTHATTILRDGRSCCSVCGHPWTGNFC